MNASGLNPEMVYVCPRCAAGTPGRWPHTEGEPCPLAVSEFELDQERRDEANVAYLTKLAAESAQADEARLAWIASREGSEAQKEYYERSGMPALDTGEAMRTMTRFFERELGDDAEDKS